MTSPSCRCQPASSSAIPFLPNEGLDSILDILISIGLVYASFCWAPTSGIMIIDHPSASESECGQLPAPAIEPIEPIEPIGPPVGRLPAEILHIIFEDMMSISTKDQVHRVRWTVSQVSQFWRACAISNQSLWTKLPVVELVAPHKGSSKENVPLLELLLERSGNAPLDVHIAVQRYNDMSRSPAIEALTAHSERWKSVEMDVSATTLNGLSSKLLGHLASLEYLELTVKDTLSPAFLKLDAFSEAPKLRQAVVRVFGRIGYLDLPYHQLKSLDMNRHLHRSDFTSFNGTEIRRSPKLTFPSLTVLHLSYLTPSDEWGLRSLVLPAIERIDIKNSTCSIYRALSAIISRSRTPCRLKVLSITRSAEMGEPGDLPELLAKTPALKSLNTRIEYPEDILAMASLEPEFALVPDLTSFTLFLSEKPVDQMAEALIRLAAVRCYADIDGSTTASMRLITPGYELPKPLDNPA